VATLPRRRGRAAHLAPERPVVSKLTGCARGRERAY
jgi:hypothetical protein